MPTTSTRSRITHSTVNQPFPISPVPRSPDAHNQLRTIYRPLLPLQKSPGQNPREQKVNYTRQACNDPWKKIGKLAPTLLSLSLSLSLFFEDPLVYKPPDVRACTRRSELQALAESRYTHLGHGGLSVAYLRALTWWTTDVELTILSGH